MQAEDGSPRMRVIPKLASLTLNGRVQRKKVGETCLLATGKYLCLASKSGNTG
jgi:hypothetical protein